MQLAPIAPRVTPQSVARPVADFAKAVELLDGVQAAAEAAVDESWSVSTTSLTGASRDAAEAAKLLDGIKEGDAATFARFAAEELDSAATAKMNEDPDVGADVVRSRGTEAIEWVLQAFHVLGLDGRVS